MPDTIIENPILNSPFREPDRHWRGRQKVTATKSGESDLDNTESTSSRGNPMIVSSVFHGAEPCHSSPNRLAVSGPS